MSEKTWKASETEKTSGKTLKAGKKHTQMPKKLSMLQELQEELHDQYLTKQRGGGNACTETASQSYSQGRSQRKLESV